MDYDNFFTSTSSSILRVTRFFLATGFKPILTTTGFLVIWKYLEEALNKSRMFLFRHSGESRNPVKTIAYWMPFCNGMTAAGFIRSFPNEQCNGIRL